METFFSFLSTPWLGTVVGFAGVALAILFYFRSKGKSRLSYQIEDFSVVGDARAKFPNELEIRFEGSAVPRVTSAVIIIWNSGDTTVNQNQIIDSDRLRLEINDGSILRSKVLNKTREVIAADSVNNSKNTVLINFEFLDPNDGFIVEVIHSGTTGDLNLHGTLKGLLNGIVKIGEGAHYPRTIRTKKSKFFLLFPIGLGIIAIVYGLAARYITPFIHSFDSSTEIRTSPNWAAIILGVAYAAFPAILLWLGRRRYPLQLVKPKQDPNP